MLLWIGFAVLTVLVLGALMKPLLGAQQTAADSADPDRAVYRDQLAELEADRARGLIGAAEAEAARIEVARRLLAKGSTKGSAQPGASAATATAPASPQPLSRAMAVALAAIPVTSIALYVMLGSPHLPARPLDARIAMPAGEANVNDLVAKVEARLREHPEDGQGWEVIAPVYLRQQRYADAAVAYAQSMRLLGETPKRLAGFAESSILASDGVVNDTARRALQLVRDADPKRMDIRFWLAVALEQDGNLAGAAKAYRELTTNLPTDAPLRGAVESRLITIAGKLANGKVAPTADAKAAADDSGMPKLSQEQMAAVQKMGPEDRVKFIAQMVDGLAQRLKENGNDLGGWARLLRAYKSLGRAEDATTALADARRKFAGDETSLAVLDALAASLGLGS